MVLFALFIPRECLGKSNCSRESEKQEMKEESYGVKRLVYAMYAR